MGDSCAPSSHVFTPHTACFAALFFAEKKVDPKIAFPKSRFSRRPLCPIERRWRATNGRFVCTVIACVYATHRMFCSVVLCREKSRPKNRVSKKSFFETPVAPNRKTVEGNQWAIRVHHHRMCLRHTSHVSQRCSLQRKKSTQKSRFQKVVFRDARCAQ